MVRSHREKRRFPSVVRSALVLLSTVLLATGCTEDAGPARVPLGGRVELAGSAVSGGSISLLPVEGHSGPAVTTAIEGGRYQFDSRNGPVAGPHRVVVLSEPGRKASSAGDLTPRSASTGGSAAKRWELQMEVPGQGPFEYDVQLD